MNILTLVPFEGFVPIMMEIVKGVYHDTGEKTIIYVSLNKPCKAIIATLQGEGMESSRFQIIDAVTKMAVKDPKAMDRCHFVSSPSSLAEIYNTFGTIIDQEDVGAVIFDSVSTLLVYEGPAVITKFLHMMITKSSLKGCHGAFIYMKEDTNNQLLHDVSLLVDLVRDYAKEMKEIEQNQPIIQEEQVEEEHKKGFLGKIIGKMTHHDSENSEDENRGETHE